MSNIGWTSEAKYTLRPVQSVQFGSPSKILLKKEGKMKKEGNKKKPNSWGGAHTVIDASTWE